MMRTRNIKPAAGPIASLLLAFVAIVCGTQVAHAITVGGVDIGDLPPGKSVTITFQNKINAPATVGTTQISNQGTVSGTNFSDKSTDDPDTAAANDATLTPLQANADLSISKSGPANVVLGNGNTLDYTIVVTNNGPASNNGGFTVTDTLPAGTTFQNSGSTPGASVSGQTVSYTNTAGLAANGTQSFTIRVSVDSSAAGTTLHNSANVATTGTGDASSSNNTSNTVDTGVAKANTTTAVTSSLNPSNFGQNVTFTATVTTSSGTPTGTVQFKDNGTAMGSAQPLSSGSATFSTSTLSVGNHAITADYSGDGNFNGSTGTLSGGQTVNAAPTPTATATATPTATATATATPTATASASATPSGTPSATPAQAMNISTRVRVDTGDKVMIGGFIIRGNPSKPVILRGLGPSLANFGIPADRVLKDPVLELHGPNGALITSNDNWKASPQRSQFEGGPFQPADDHEAIILATLPPGAYTAILSGAGGTTGIGLVEIYDADQSISSDLANISTRGFVKVQDEVMIGGFTLGGNNMPSRMVVRALGPSLANFGLTSLLADPTLELHNANGTVMVANDDWQSDPVSATQLSANGLAPSDPKEAAIFLSLAPPGQFTAVVAGKNGTVGVALVEIYDLR